MVLQVVIPVSVYLLTIVLIIVLMGWGCLRMLRRERRRFNRLLDERVKDLENRMAVVEEKKAPEVEEKKEEAKPVRTPYFIIEEEPKPDAGLSKDERLVKRVTGYVEKNLSRCDLSVEEVSREVGISRVHLCKRLTALTGKSPVEFIRALRLKEASRLLVEGGRSVSEVAIEVGINNPKYFTKYFKEEYGMTPSAYQQMHHA